VGEYLTDKELVPPVAEAYYSYGHAVEIDGDQVVVTAPGDDQAATDAGAAFVLGRNQGGPDNWGQVHKLIPTDAGAGDFFGQACAIDGNLVVVSSLQGDGSLSHGAVYFFDRTTGLQTAKRTIPNPKVFDFGKALDTDGTHVIVGAGKHWTDPNWLHVGVAYIFDAAGSLVHTLSPSDAHELDSFGSAVAIDGNLCLVASPSKWLGFGAVYVFDVTTGAELFKLMGSDAAMLNAFGYDVALEGTRAIIGSPGSTTHDNSDGAAFLFDLTTGAELARFDTEVSAGSSAGLGTSVAIHGDYAFLGCPIPNDYTVPTAGRLYQVDLDYRYIMAWFVHPYHVPSMIASRVGYGVATDGITIIDGYGDSSGGGILGQGRAHLMTRAQIGLGVDKESPASGETLTFNTRGGLIGGFCGSALVAVNGTPIAPWILPGSIGLFDGQGEWSFQGPVPPGLSGLVLTVMSGGLAKTGGFVLSNTRDISVL